MIRIKMTVFILLFTLCLMVDMIFTKDGVNCALRVKTNDRKTLFRQLLAHNLTLHKEITPSTYIFEYTGSRKKSALHRTILNIKTRYTSKIKDLERVREYKDTLKPVNALKHWDSDMGLIDKTPIRHNILNQPNLICDHYYGMGVQEAWARGYTGDGVTIAITDVGVNTELLDLENNIDTNMSYNFIDESSNVEPEYFHNIQKKSSHLTDHGNEVASIIAASKGNGICSAGIAYNATIIALKIYKVKVLNDHIPVLEPSHWTRSDIIATALVYKLDTIDIFANAWAPTKPFDMLDLATRDAISYGAKHGRHDLGRIHVVPSGPPGNGLSNNIATITVNSIGKDGAIPDHTYIDASVLTSGLGEGNNLSSSSMVTTTLRNRCVTGFNGVSAATAQVSAVIGLALGANENLSLRDVQHLLVHTSDHRELRKTKSAFRSNAAGRHFHEVFGFGLVDADKLISRALIQAPTRKLRTETLNAYITGSTSGYTQVFEFCHSCDKSNGQTCVANMEHILVEMDIKSSSDDIKMEIKSPGGTTSVLMQVYPKRGKPVDVRKLQLVSVHFWDEIAFGPWSLYVQDRHSRKTSISQLSVTLYGTADPKIARFQHQYSNICRANMDKDISTTKTKSKISLSSESPESTKNTKQSSDMIALVVLPVLAVVVLFLVILYKRYNLSLMSILSYCPTKALNVYRKITTNDI